MRLIQQFDGFSLAGWHTDDGAYAFKPALCQQHLLPQAGSAWLSAPTAAYFSDFCKSPLGLWPPAFSTSTSVFPMLASGSWYSVCTEHSCVCHLPRWHQVMRVSDGSTLDDKTLALTPDGTEAPDRGRHFISVGQPLSHVRLPRHALANLCRFLL